MEQQKLTMAQLEQMQGETVYSSEGEKIGTVEEVFYDEQTNAPEWIGIGTGFLGTKRVLVPIEGAALGDDGITVPYAKEQVKDSPDVDGDEIGQDTEGELYAHYGLAYSERRSETGLPEGGRGRAIDQGLSREDDHDRGDTPSVVRSEEELEVGTRQVESGSVRLRKWVETEDANLDVKLKRETAKVTRQPMDEVVSGAEIGEEEIEMPLHREEAVVQKQVVGKERITLEKDTETETETVSDEVRKERVDVDEDR